MRITHVRDFSETVKYIDIGEADADFVSALKRNNTSVFAIITNKGTVGCCQLLRGNNAYLYIYIFPKYRKMGYGTQAASLCENMLSDGNALPRMITACFRKDDEPALLFAAKNGYAIQYSSTYMEYDGDSFPDTSLAVRQYQECDYDAAHSLYADAFHHMRLSTGLFPNSVVEPPSEAMREYWGKTCGERVVCLHNDEIIGYAHIDGKEIASVSVKREYQGRGYGRKFVKELVNLLRSLGNETVSLCCVVGNNGAYALYTSLGFKDIYTNTYAVKVIPSEETV